MQAPPVIVICLALSVVACEPAGKPAARGAAVGAKHAASAAPAPAKHVLLFVGTSLTAGYGLEADQAYPALIARRLDSLGESYEVVNAGVSGETSADALHRIAWVLRRPADVIVIEAGANDGLRGLSVDSMRANLKAIIDSIRAIQPRAKIALAAMEALPNMGPRYAVDFRRAYPAVATAEHVTLLPFLLLNVAGVDSLVQPDGLHPNARGSLIVATNVLGSLRPLLDSLSATR